MNGLFDSISDRTRVAERIGGYVVEFFADRGDGSEFHADDLRQYVIAREPKTAPGSPDRIMRLLRQAGRIQYAVVNRRKSLYRIGGGH